MNPIYERDGVQIFIDEDPVSPREYDNLGKMITAHKRYDLGDERAPRDMNSWGEVCEALTKKYGPCIFVPIFMLDHSGLTLSTTCEGFIKCDPQRYDWGQLGYNYVPLHKVRTEYGVQKVSPKLRKKVTEVLTKEVEEYDQYLRGEVYGFVYGDDSCWGYIGYTPEQLAELVLKGEV